MTFFSNGGHHSGNNDFWTQRVKDKIVEGEIFPFRDTSKNHSTDALLTRQNTTTAFIPDRKLDRKYVSPHKGLNLHLKKGMPSFYISPLYVSISLRSALKDTLSGSLSVTLADESWKSPLIEDKEYN